MTPATKSSGDLLSKETIVSASDSVDKTPVEEPRRTHANALCRARLQTNTTVFIRATMTL